VTLEDRVQDAIAAHLAETGDGGMVTAFHLAVEFVDSAGDDAWLYVTAPRQRMSHTLGLIEWSRGVALYEQRRYLDEETG
jgi:hypothetical protein